MSVRLTSPAYIRDLLKELNFKPGKSMGQNFLIDANILKIILDSAELNPEDSVLEIGPGLGVLTDGLTECVRRVVAIEKDVKLYAFLESRYSAKKNIELINADALDLPLNSILASGITKVVSNLPYSVGSRILVNIFKAHRKPQTIAVTLQTDVAERIAASPGGGQYGLMSVLAQRFYEVSIEKTVGPNCFMPRPRVDSALLVCKLRPKPLVEVLDDELFLRMVKMTFTHRRKIITNALRGAGFDTETATEALIDAGIDVQSRPAVLSVEDWGRLSDALTRKAPEQ